MHNMYIVITVQYISCACVNVQLCMYTVYTHSMIIYFELVWPWLVSYDLQSQPFSQVQPPFPCRVCLLLFCFRGITRQSQVGLYVGWAKALGLVDRDGADG